MQDYLVSIKKIHVAYIALNYSGSEIEILSVLVFKGAICDLCLFLYRYRRDGAQ